MPGAGRALRVRCGIEQSTAKERDEKSGSKRQDDLSGVRLLNDQVQPPPIQFAEHRAIASLNKSD